MKKLLVFLICIISLFLLSACNNNNSTPQEIADEVTINLPTDNSVNGYRTQKVTQSGMPDSISGDEVNIGDIDSAVTKEYCANKNSKVFHKSSCASVSKIKESNKYYAARETLISGGYKPCGKCKP